jgi:sulfatase modifying factor 1
MVKQDNYRVKLKATGGLKPYTWEDFTIVGQKVYKLSWLTLQEDENDSSIAYLTNRVKNGAPLVPEESSAESEGLKIKVTVFDNSKHGDKTDTDRVDNIGYTFEHAIAIRESACENGDEFCPATCIVSTDNDCPITCGDQVVSSGETCDKGINAGQEGACPTSCNDGVACTTDTLQKAGTCQAECVSTLITECKDSDSCCPDGCDNNNDKDCSVTCGNGIKEDGETCDPKSSCPTNCNDGNACTIDIMMGSIDNCNIACIHTTNKTCSINGGCCPSSVAGVDYNMKYVPGGEFPTGINDTGGSQTASAFWIGETEVTYKLWNAVYKKAGEKGYIFANAGREGAKGIDGADPTEAAEEPVTMINWRDAMVWCNLASELAGLTAVYYSNADLITPIRRADNNAVDSTTLTAGHEDNPYIKDDANGFRLPESMQWECAARYQNGSQWTPGNHVSGDITGCCYSSSSNPCTISDDFGNYAWYVANASGNTHRVATRIPNALGIYDMSGNVWEWLFDWYTSDSSRVVRGGSHNENQVGLQVGYVGSVSPRTLGVNFGFRLMRTR